MTTEEDFNKLLDLCIYDWQTRLIFADWLQERDDCRHYYYRQFGTDKRRPTYRCSSYSYQNINTYNTDYIEIPLFRLLEHKDSNFLYYAWYPSRKLCETDCANAFYKLYHK